MAEPEKDFDKLRKEQEKDDADILADLDKESKEFDKVFRGDKTIITFGLTFPGLRDRTHTQCLPCERI